jgi:hypothetical protein
MGGSKIQKLAGKGGQKLPIIVNLGQGIASNCGKELVPIASGN